MKTTYHIFWLFATLLLLLVCAATAEAQDFSSQKTVIVYSTRFSEAKNTVNKYIQYRATRVIKKEEMPARFMAEFVLEEKHLNELDSIVARIGWVSENKQTMQNEQLRIAQLKEAVQEEEAKLLPLKEKLSQPDLKFTEREQLKAEIAQMEASLKQQRQELRTKSESAGKAYVVLQVFDEMTTPTNTKSGVAFVNMPGVEYGFMKVENPKVGLSAESYQGYSIKYLFTRGKSYCDLGVYKAINNTNEDTSMVKELFMINFGQDFYPRHFGRGHRKYFNLYSCYQVGGLVATQNNEENTRFIPNLNLGLGVELIKTKHILLDNKITYMLPLHYTNRNLRSVLYNASFNFVF